MFYYSFYLYLNFMFILNSFKKLIYSFDMFCSSELLRYNQGTQYKTFTGGLLSVGIIAVIIVGFASMIVDTFNKTSITSDATNIRQTDPTPITLTANRQNNFMFAVAITSRDIISFKANLSGTTRYFDVIMRINEYVNTTIVASTVIPLEMCTKQHWKMIPEFSEKFDSLGNNRWLCLPIGYNLSLNGAFSSTYYKFASVQVFSCKNKTIYDNCAPQANIDSLFTTFGTFTLSYMYVNPIINPNQPNYISYYFEQNDYTLFSKTISSQAWLYFTDYSINSDNSILPFTDVNINTGAIVQAKSTNNACAPAAGLLASVILAKSPNSLIINRQVQKISAVFSYIGGLVGAVTAVLFMVKSYTDSSLEVTIGFDLFEKEKEGEQHEGFNLLGFIRLSVYRLLKSFKWKGEWKVAKKLDQYQEEAVKQLDIRLLLKRLITLQSYFNHLISKQKPEQLNQWQHQITLRTAKKMRTQMMEKVGLREMIKVEQFKQSGPDAKNNNFSVFQIQQSGCGMFGKFMKNSNLISKENQLANSDFWPNMSKINAKANEQNQNQIKQKNYFEIKIDNGDPIIKSNKVSNIFSQL